MTQDAKTPWGTPPTDPKQAEALAAAAKAAEEMAAGAYAKKLVKMKRDTAPFEADVHESEVDSWMQGGWVKA